MFDGSTMYWAVPVIEVAFTEISFATDAVQAFICLKIYISVVITSL